MLFGGPKDNACFSNEQSVPVLLTHTLAVQVQGSLWRTDCSPGTIFHRSAPLYFPHTLQISALYFGPGILLKIASQSHSAKVSKQPEVHGQIRPPRLPIEFWAWRPFGFNFLLFYGTSCLLQVSYGKIIMIWKWDVMAWRFPWTLLSRMVGVIRSLPVWLGDPEFLCYVWRCGETCSWWTFSL